VTPPLRCATAITLPGVREAPFVVGVDGAPVSEFVVLHDRAPAPAIAVGDRICGFIRRQREPPFFIRHEAIVVDERGAVVVASSDTGTMTIPGWSFRRGAGRRRGRVSGGTATWWSIDVEHQRATATIGVGPWPELAADDGRYRVMGTDYEKEGTLVPEEAPTIRDFAIVRLTDPAP
jgi:hypothetical protein